MIMTLIKSFGNIGGLGMHVLKDQGLGSSSF